MTMPSNFEIDSAHGIRTHTSCTWNYVSGVVSYLSLQNKLQYKNKGINDQDFICPGSKQVNEHETLHFTIVLPLQSCLTRGKSWVRLVLCVNTLYIITPIFPCQIPNYFFYDYCYMNLLSSYSAVHIYK